jgi:hypothetical protein
LSGFGASCLRRLPAGVRPNAACLLGTYVELAMRDWITGSVPETVRPDIETEFS